MRRAYIFPFFLLCCTVCAQDISEAEAVRSFFGTDDMEQLDQYDVEQIQDLLRNPLEINMAGRLRLESCGLLSAYQAASIMQYRKEHGDILSVSELAAVDGFGGGYAGRIAPFLSFRSSLMPGQKASDGKVSKHELAVRGGLKKRADEPLSWNAGMKYRLLAGSRASGAFALSRSHGKESFLSGHLSWNSRKTDSKVVLGDFNARFGQGLILWNGMSMSGVPDASSMVKRAAGISQSWSFTGSSAFTGVAVSGNYGGFSISALLSEEGLDGIRNFPDGLSLLPAVHLSWLTGCWQFSMTNYAMFSSVLTSDPRIPDFKSSMDMKCCLKGVDVAAELAWDWVGSSPAAIVVSSFPAGESLRLGVSMRYYSPDFSSTRSAAIRSGTKCSDECGASMAADLRFGRYVAINGAEGFGSSRQKFRGTVTLDASCSSRLLDGLTGQCFKAVNMWDVMLSGSLQMLLKLSLRVRPDKENPSRSEIRTDLKYLTEHFVSTLRLDMVSNIKPSLLSYLEGGYRNERLSLYARIGVFFVDNWDDRIYAYERDAPGSFNVPAYYGRGMWTALTFSWRFSRWGRLYGRSSWISYPFMNAEKKKPGQAELKLQMNVSF